MPVGVAAAMIVHAAGESSTGDLDLGTYAIVLATKSEKELQDRLEILKVNKVDFTPIYEPDLPWNGQLMAIGLKPIPRNIGRKFLSCLLSYKGFVPDSYRSNAATQDEHQSSCSPVKNGEHV